jgi:1-acyl-sn-glycerol-3-phosphate acyltransferase
MIGTREAQPIGKVMPRLFMPITIRIAPPLSFERFSERADDPLVLRQITDEVMFQLRELSGQEYVHRYAKRHDAVEGAGAEPVHLSSEPSAQVEPTSPELATAG